ncbi:zinc-binding dehydrogenase [Sphingomonas sp. dw_22]|uniref:zinc-binding dehydrogenase n=1 Tax=Sphingomonas sp. dw_22 TaxID=2721175 RepID=UPI001BD4E9B7|nr:zinc-binding dehydrogenase [Sphingomonas sp. dw_22]
MPAFFVWRRSRSEILLVARFASADGAFHPVVARTFSLDEIAEAHRFMEAGEQIGKIIVTV